MTKLERLYSSKEGTAVNAATLRKNLITTYLVVTASNIYAQVTTDVSLVFDGEIIGEFSYDFIFDEHRDLNRIETIDLHAEDKGEEPYSPPIDKEHEDAEFGDFLSNPIHCS